MLIKPNEGNEASVGDGVMVALALATTAEINVLHAKTMHLGGTDEGSPGYREETFYRTYFRGPDGNEVCLQPRWVVRPFRARFKCRAVIDISRQSR